MRRRTKLSAILAAGVALASAPAQADGFRPGSTGSARIEIRGYVPLVCALDARRAGTSVSVDHSCNTPHEVRLAYPPDALPEGRLTVLYGGERVTLEPDGETVIWESGFHRGRQVLQVEAEAETAAAFLSTASLTVHTR